LCGVPVRSHFCVALSLGALLQRGLYSAMADGVFFITFFIMLKVFAVRSDCDSHFRLNVFIAWCIVDQPRRALLELPPGPSKGAPLVFKGNLIQKVGLLVAVDG
jgi:hypothetical protein